MLYLWFCDLEQRKDGTEEVWGHTVADQAVGQWLVLRQGTTKPGATLVLGSN